ncbi:MAG: hypothetical protein ACO23H_19310 [Alphaproteobacteria bacterium]
MAHIVLAVAAAGALGALVTPEQKKEENFGSCPTLGNAVRRQLGKMASRDDVRLRDNELMDGAAIGGLQPREVPQVMRDGGQHVLNFNEQMRAMAGQPGVKVTSRETQNDAIPGSTFRKELYNWGSDPEALRFAEESVSATRNDLRPRKQIRVGPGIGLGYGEENSRYMPRIYPPGATADDLRISKKVDITNIIPAGKNQINTRAMTGTMEIKRTAQESNGLWGSSFNGSGGHGERRDGILDREDNKVVEKMIQGGGKRDGGPRGQQRTQVSMTNDSKHVNHESFDNVPTSGPGSMRLRNGVVNTQMLGAVHMGDNDGLRHDMEDRSIPLPR